jgi:hypothetical protein
MTELMTQVFDVSCWLSACKCSTGTVPRAVRRCFSVTRARTFPSRIHLRSRAYPVLRILCGWGELAQEVPTTPVHNPDANQLNVDNSNSANAPQPPRTRLQGGIR